MDQSLRYFLGFCTGINASVKPIINFKVTLEHYWSSSQSSSFSYKLNTGRRVMWWEMELLTMSLMAMLLLNLHMGWASFLMNYLRLWIFSFWSWTFFLVSSYLDMPSINADKFTIYSRIVNLMKLWRFRRVVSFDCHFN